MTDKFYPTDIKKLITIILNQLKLKNEFFGIPYKLAYDPDLTSVDLTRNFWGKTLATPIGLAAGPHTQLAQNIVAGWLCGARFIELKTVQILDELEVTKPCIDMQDLGFNCEWSQELKIDQSLREYQSAWVIIHILNGFLFNKLGKTIHQPGTIFNASVGYNLEGIKSAPIDRFLNEIRDVSAAIAKMKEEIGKIFPEFSHVEIPSNMVDTLTLSTMHGCPPSEIEAIGKYLLEEKHFNLLIKLNPTLLGKERVREIVNRQSGFDVEIPDIAFDHDPKFEDAVRIIKSLKDTAGRLGLKFGIKLSNTLETVNSGKRLPDHEKMVYMSGRGLLPVTVNLAYELQKAFSGKLDISYSGGADYQNIDKLIGCGFYPVTVCSDLLKPGGYGRLAQYFETLENNFKENKSVSIDDFIMAGQPGSKNIQEAAFKNLAQLAHEVLTSEKYRKIYIHEPNIKSQKPLEMFDCNHAPCIDQCATNQDIPEYINLASKGSFNEALDVIRKTNPLPSITGTICDHLCQYSCIRSHYDEPVRIRDIKRSVVHQTGTDENRSELIGGHKKVAIIGAGPGGLSCAHYLSESGVRVEVFDKMQQAGGMVSFSLPQYRIENNDIQLDLKKLSPHIKFSFNREIDIEKFSDLLKDVDFVVLASGAWKPRKMNIPGVDLNGIIDPVELLHQVNTGKTPVLGKNVVIIGGGNTAMDAARTAKRLTGKNGNVTVIYRRSITEMPADEGEIKAAIAEGIHILEQSAPSEFMGKDEKVNKINCLKTSLIIKENGERADFEVIQGSEFEIDCDTAIPAIGHIKSAGLFEKMDIQQLESSIFTNHPNLFIIGDAAHGASTAIKAIADGKNAALSILKELNLISWYSNSNTDSRDIDLSELKLKKFRREFPFEPSTKIQDLNHPPTPLSQKDCINESKRCLQCDFLCGNCTTVCPNLANVLISIKPVTFTSQLVYKNGNDYQVSDFDLFKTEQDFQVFNIGDWCNECGNCTTFCPTMDAPYQKKTRIHLSKESFDNDKRGYFIEGDGIIKVYQKTEDQIFTLEISENDLNFFGKGYHIVLSKKDFRIAQYEIIDSSINHINTLPAFQMKYICDAVLNSALITKNISRND